MQVIIKNSIRFVLLVLLQTLIFNQLEIGLGIHPMVYPLFIMLLPFNTAPVLLLLIAFLMGFLIDIFSNTGGLHASSLLLFALFRPIIFKAFSPRDGYESNKEPTIYEMGRQWYLYCFGTLLLIHHLWFFFMEVYKFSEILFVLRKLIFTVPISYLLAILIQFLFIKRKIFK